MNDDARQAKVIAIVNAINLLLAEADFEERCTALSLAAACQIIATSNNDEQRCGMARSFAQHTCYFFGPEFVDWVKAGVYYWGDTSQTKQ